MTAVTAIRENQTGKERILDEVLTTGVTEKSNEQPSHVIPPPSAGELSGAELTSVPMSRRSFSSDNRHESLAVHPRGATHFIALHTSGLCRTVDHL